MIKGQLSQISKYQQKLKLITIGDTSTGKTSILLKYTDNKFTLNQGPTIGVDYMFKDYNYKHINYKLQIFDTAGQDKFHSLMKKYYQGADATVLVFSLQDWYKYYKKNQETLPIQRIQYWLTQLKNNNNNRQSKIVFMGNKKDLIIQQLNSKQFLEAVELAFEKYILQYKTKLFFSSVLTGQNIFQSFQFLISLIFNEKQSFQRPKSFTIRDQIQYEVAQEKAQQIDQNKNKNDFEDKAKLKNQKNNLKKGKKKGCC